ncbi:MAG TPA: AI-2E family transporter [Brevibacterium senegalense]|uniref:AI-2E family transporter n=1 Tax=Brevibacterium senegalense TaxID=1033736 RepID=A0A921ME92_9MICO|nr:AI-2E family transporter [Brevibacterium senegalense]
MSADASQPTARPDLADAAPAAGTAESGPTAWGLPRYVLVTVGIAALVVTIAVFRELQSIVAPVFLALNLVIIVHPLQAHLIRLRVPRFVAAMVTVLVVLALLAAFFALTGWSIARLVILLPSYTEKMLQIVQDSAEWLATMGLTPAFLEDQLAAIDANSVAGAAGAVFSNVSTVVGLLTSVVMAVFFVAMDSMSIDHRLRATAAVRPRFAQALTSFAQGVRRYWVVATIFGLIVAFLDVIALEIIGVPLALVWGVLAFLTNYIPNVGFVIGLVPPALLALVDQGWVAALWVVIAYSVLNFVIQSIIQPKFTGESVGVTPFISFLSLLFWYWVLGALGALLALPATLLLKAFLVDADPKARWVNNLIASDLRTGAGLPIGRRSAVSSLRRREVIVPLDR